MISRNVAETAQIAALLRTPLCACGHFFPAEDADNLHRPIDNRHVVDSVFVHDLACSVAVFIFVTEDHLALHDLSHAPILWVMTMRFHISVGIDLADHPHKLTVFRHRPCVRIRLAHSLPSGSDAVMRGEDTHLVARKFLQGRRFSAFLPICNIVRVVHGSRPNAIIDVLYQPGCTLCASFRSHS